MKQSKVTSEAFEEARGIKVFLSSLPDQGKQGEDEKLRDGLARSLAPLCESGRMTLWHDGLVKAGEILQEEINDHLEAAQVILLLLSPEFFASPLCLAQMERARQRHLQEGTSIIPIRLREISGLKYLPIGELVSLPKTGKSIASKPDKDHAWYEVAEALDSLISSIEPPVASLLAPVDRLPEERPIYRDILLMRPPVPDSAPMVSRTTLVEEIYQCLSLPERITALILTGLSGAGKTTLAAQVYYLAEREQEAGRGPFAYPPLWLDLGTTSTLMDAVGSLSSALGHPLSPIFCNFTPKALAEELFSLLSKADRLIIFDQFETWLDVENGRAFPAYAGADEWLTLLNAGAEGFSGRVLLTSHVYPHELFRYGAGCVQPLKLPDLTTQESIQLLRLEHISAIEQATEGELKELVQRYQGHAQALIGLRTLCVSDPGLCLADLLHNPQWIKGVHFQTFNALYTRLRAKSRALLHALATYRDAVPFDAVLELVPSQHRSAINRFSAEWRALLDLYWLQSSGPDRYRLHPVIAGFVNMKRTARAQRDMHLKAALHYQARFQRTLFPGEPRAREDFFPLIEAVWHLCQASEREKAYHLLQETELFVHLHRWGQNSSLLALYLELLQGADQQQESTQAARLYNELGEIRNALGQKNEALQAYQQAWNFFRRANKIEGMVEALNNKGAMLRALQKHEQAQECYKEALNLCEQAGSRLPQQGTTLNNLGRLAYDLGNQERSNKNRGKAIAYYRTALEWYQKAQSWYQLYKLDEEEAVVLNNLGDILQAFDEYEAARHCYRYAVYRFKERGNRRGEGLALNSLGSLYKDMADLENNFSLYEEARACYEQALRLFQETGDRWQERITLRNLGRLYPHFAQREYYQLSLACFIGARRIAAELSQSQDKWLPSWVEQIIVGWLRNSGPQSYEEFLQDTDKLAQTLINKIIERADPYEL